MRSPSLPGGRATSCGAKAGGERARDDAMIRPSPGRYRLGDVRHITADCTAAECVLGWRAEIDLTSGIQSLLAGPAGPGISSESP